MFNKIYMFARSPTYQKIRVIQFYLRVLRVLEVVLYFGVHAKHCFEFFEKEMTQKLFILTSNEFCKIFRF